MFLPFQRIEEPFIKAVMLTLGDRYSDNMDVIYKILIKFILENLDKALREAMAAASWYMLSLMTRSWFSLNTLHHGLWIASWKRMWTRFEVSVTSSGGRWNMTTTTRVAGSYQLVMAIEKLLTHVLLHFCTHIVCWVKTTMFESCCMIVKLPRIVHCLFIDPAQTQVINGK